ncbi:MAG: hypothetical protein HY847_12405 [Betaproteobacteria bacterium]|nr:hypothetical protein [Betaproteobacteria bacterium]
MREYAKMFPQFWIGETGKKLHGDPEAQVLACYLISNPHANMIGLFYLPMIYLCHETGLTQEGASKALQRVCELGFCEYDEETETVWLVEAARFQIADRLRPNDKQTKGIANELSKFSKTRLAAAFAEKYKEAFHLPDDLVRALSSKPLARTSEASFKTLRSQEQEQEQEQAQALPASPGVSVPSSKKKRKPVETPLPEDFSLSEATIAWATRKGINRLDERLEHFIGVAKAKGYIYADWQQAFQNAARDDWANLNGKSKPDGTPADRSIFAGAI